MGQFSVYYVPATPLKPGPSLNEIGRRLWQLGMPFMENEDFGELPEDSYDIELIHEGMGIVDSELGDLVPHLIDNFSCPHCKCDLLYTAYDIWEDETATTPTSERAILCPQCQATLTGPQLISNQPFTFATSYLYVSDIDPDYWPDKVKTDIEALIGPCTAYLAWET
jgi:hypothetical protein